MASAINDLRRFDPYRLHGRHQQLPDCAGRVAWRASMNGIHRRRDWSELARFADACVDLRLRPHQEMHRLSMLRAMVEELTAQMEIEAAAAAERPRKVEVPNEL